MKKLVSFGEVLVDQIITNDGAPSMSAGGAPANVAACYSKLGGKSFFVGGIGTDDKAIFLIEELQKIGVDISYVKVFKDAKTAKAVISLDEENERSFDIFRNGTADTLFRKTHLDLSVFEKGFFFHFCSNTLTDPYLLESTYHAVELAVQNKMLVCFDVNLRLDLWSEQSQVETRVSEFYNRCDVIKMSREELNYLADKVGKTENEYIRKCFSFEPQLIIVTDGAKEIKCYTHEAVISVNPPKITVEDTTAAGDAFIGGFLWSIGKSVHNVKDLNSIFSKQETIREALEFAALCSAFTCSTRGTFEALPSNSNILELQQLM